MTRRREKIQHYWTASLVRRPRGIIASSNTRKEVHHHVTHEHVEYEGHVFDKGRRGARHKAKHGHAWHNYWQELMAQNRRENGV